MPTISEHTKEESYRAVNKVYWREHTTLRKELEQHKTRKQVKEEAQNEEDEKLDGTRKEKQDDQPQPTRRSSTRSRPPRLRFNPGHTQRDIIKEIKHRNARRKKNKDQINKQDDAQPNKQHVIKNAKTRRPSRQRMPRVPVNIGGDQDNILRKSKRGKINTTDFRGYTIETNTQKASEVYTPENYKQAKASPDNKHC